MSTTTRFVTAEELFQMPDNGARRELVRGEVREMCPAGHAHGRIGANFMIPLGSHVRAHHLGQVYLAETGFLLERDPDTVRAPDVAFISRARLSGVDDSSAYWPGAPDLAVEVVSPSDNYTEVEDKVFAWLEAGARLVIVLDPRRCRAMSYRSLTAIAVHSRQDTLDCSDVVPGFAIPLSEIFD